MNGIADYAGNLLNHVEALANLQPHVDNTPKWCIYLR
jgi:hypothetical protein